MDGMTGHSVMEDEQAPAREERHMRGQLQLIRILASLKAGLQDFNPSSVTQQNFDTESIKSDERFGLSCQDNGTELSYLIFQKDTTTAVTFALI